ncbi:MAG: biotin synthase [Hyperthermus sp.]|nr:MAG: biotin synthase [Hyperthermus sp.]
MACSTETRVRISLGSLALLKRLPITMFSKPTTLYLLQYSEEGCLASCMYCSQSRVAGDRLRSRGYLSRITWPVINISDIVKRRRAIRDAGFERLCIQSILKPGFLEELECIISHLLAIELPISLAITPVGEEALEKLRELGVEYLGVGLDAATPRIFNKVGKPYTWKRYMEFIESGVKIFGKGRVYVHIIAGLGETLKEAVDTMKMLYEKGAKVALFNYTHVPGLPRLPGIELKKYRLLQLARFMLEKGHNPYLYLRLDEGREGFKRKPPVQVEELGEAVLTSGCPGCNRPFYNESPRGPIYNYPSRAMLESMREKWMGEILSLLNE